jgi:hypothetical protein
MIGKTMTLAVSAILLMTSPFWFFGGGAGVARGQFGVPVNSLVPAPPQDVMATPGNRMAKVEFAPPKTDGGSRILYYTVVSHPGGIMVQGTKSPVVVKGLANGKTYIFTVTASNSVGTGRPSGPSNCVTPGG